MALHFFVPTNKSTLADSMGEVLREAAKACVIPRFRALDPSDICEKSPGDLVTTADREAEAMIAARLSALLPSARIVGEEACEGGPDLFTGLSQGEVWIIDPIDGTGNYAAGRAPFAMMAALLREGDVVASA
ncbi:MAG: inositol monophosphatase family protein, partial [Pseudomonadota bacterium]